MNKIIFLFKIKFNKMFNIFKKLFQNNDEIFNIFHYQLIKKIGNSNFESYKIDIIEGAVETIYIYDDFVLIAMIQNVNQFHIYSKDEIFMEFIDRLIRHHNRKYRL